MGAGLLFAGQRLLKGDFKGAMLEAASGIASTIPGVGTAVSIGLDATLAAKDMGVLLVKNKQKNSNLVYKHLILQRTCMVDLLY